MPSVALKLMTPGSNGGSVICLMALGAACILLPSTALADESFTLCCGMTATSAEHSGYLGSTSTMVRVFIFDSGSAWLPDFINLGYVNPDVRLTITNFGAVSTPGAILIGNTSSPFFKSTNNGLVIKTGGQLNVASGTIGYGGSSSNTVLVTDPTSAWHINTPPGLGLAGGAFNSLTVSNGAMVMNFSDGSIAGNNNRVLITGSTSGPPSTWHNMGNLSVGGTKSLVTVADGAHLDNMNAVIAPVSSTSNSVTITGMGSLWGNNGNLIMGPGSYGQLTISNRGMAGSINGYVDGFANRATVSGTGSVWGVQQNLYLAFAPFSLSGELMVTNGGTVFNRDGYIGFTEAPFGNNALVTSPGSLWNNNGDLFVGYASAFNQIAVTEGAKVTSGNTYIGYSNVVVGPTPKVKGNRMLVDGPGASWENSSNVFVGYGGFSNALTVSRGGTASCNNAVIGLQPQSSNNVVLVTGAQSAWLLNGNLINGAEGSSNQLVVANGGRVENFEGFVGYYSSNNTAFVMGNPSVWTNADNLTIGLLGAANRLIVSAGAEVESLLGRIGASFDPGMMRSPYSNSVLVTGLSSFWNMRGGLRVGEFGNYNSLTVENSGRVYNGAGNIGSGTFSVGDWASVTSSGLWTNAGNLAIGSIGSFSNRLSIASGGRVDCQYDGFVGQGASATRNVAIVADAGSGWNCGATLYVGDDGAMNLLIVTNGGAVLDTNGFIGRASASSTGNVAVVTGAGSTWNNAGALDVGGRASHLQIEQGGAVSSGTASTLGGLAGEDKNSAIVRDFGSRWDIISNFYVGNMGASNQLTITNRGVVSGGGNFYIGAASSDNSVSIRDFLSRWSTFGDVFVGDSGSRNQLEITNGAAVDQNANVGNGAGSSNNTVVVSGPTAGWTTRATLLFGVAGHDNHLQLSEGGKVTDVNGCIGHLTGGDHNSVNLMGTSLWQNANNLFVGHVGSSNQLTIGAGAQVTSTSAAIGQAANANDNSVFVTGPAALWDNAAGQLDIGVGGTRNRIEIAAGGEVHSANATFGGAAGADENSALITGPGSLWRNDFDLFLGMNGSRNQLVIEVGAELIDMNCYLGSNPVAPPNPPSDDNSITVSGAGSHWENSGNMFVGWRGSRNQLSIDDGAAVESVDGQIGFSPASVDNSATVSCQNSTWLASGSLYVGNSGSNSLLTITSGGRVDSDNGYLGFAAASANNTVLVTGPSSTWTIHNGLYVGNNGRGNRLTIENGGSVSAGLSAVVGLASADNRVTVAVGSFRVVDSNDHTATLLLLRGSFFLVNGSVITDRLVVTNGADGVFNFGGGRLDTRETVIANTLPFTVGNGSNTATLNFLGGKHSFTDGLAINTNAFLTGTGTNVGNVTNFGTLSPSGSNGLGVLTIQGNYTQSNAGMFEVDIGGTVPGTGFDQLNISGMATLSGALHVTFTNGFSPGPGSSFRVMNFGSHAGVFTNLSGLTAPNGLTLVPRYSATDLTLVETNAPLRLDSVRRVGTNLFFNVATISGLSYLVEYTGSLNPPNWQLLQTIPGDGTLHTVQVPITSAGERYFRIRIE